MDEPGSNRSKSRILPRAQVAERDGVHVLHPQGRGGRDSTGCPPVNVSCSRTDDAAHRLQSSLPPPPRFEHRSLCLGERRFETPGDLKVGHDRTLLPDNARNLLCRGGIHAGLIYVMDGGWTQPAISSRPPKMLEFRRDVPARAAPGTPRRAGLPPVAETS